MYPGTHARTRESTQLARALRDRGRKRGDCIAILMYNDARHLNVCWAAQRSGMYFVPVNWHLTSPEILHILKDSNARALITNTHNAPSAADLLVLAPSLNTRIALDVELTGFEDYEEILSLQPADHLMDESEGSDLIYTSGTSGYPKGGFKPLPENHPSDPDPGPEGFTQLYSMDVDSRFLTPGAPLYHSAPHKFAMAITRLGGTNVIMKKFDPCLALKAIDEHKVTHSQWVPTMFVRLLRLDDAQRKEYDLSSQVVALHAAAPCPISIKEQMISWWGPIIHEYYGGSEGGTFTCLSSTEWLDHKGSVGRAMIGILHIVDDEGFEVPTGEVGIVYGENGAPICYLNDPEKTAQAHSAEGWTTVGDVGYVDADGYLYLTDRKDHMIISGGVNIYPQEAENVLIQHPLVADVAVIGIPNDDFGEEVKGVVELIEGEIGIEQLGFELVEYCRAQLAAYKCPRSIDFTEQLPRAPSGKLYKRRLRDQYWADRPSRLV
jgi:long-chain acyl-CoA synthetase